MEVPHLPDEVASEPDAAAVEQKFWLTPDHVSDVLDRIRDNLTPLTGDMISGARLPGAERQ